MSLWSYRSPVTGLPLAPDTPHSLREVKKATEVRERWPVVDGIPYLRVGREALAAEALAALDAGDRVAALSLLLADADDWWTEPPPPRADLAALVSDAGRLTLRQAMDALGYGRVGTYFAHRWSDPTFVAGLALIEGWTGGMGTAFELGCGIGHYLRALEVSGTAAFGGDVVFSKLWVARHWVVPAKTELVCFDASAQWPLLDAYDLIFCIDAFYFMPDKAGIARQMTEFANKQVLVGHIHNAGVARHSAGAAVRPSELLAMFPSAFLYDDAELTRAGAFGDPIVARAPRDLKRAEAISLAHPFPLRGPVGEWELGWNPDRPLVRNPLYVDGRIAWPSERYRDEYAALATYPERSNVPATLEYDEFELPDAARRREFVQLPERW